MHLLLWLPLQEAVIQLSVVSIVKGINAELSAHDVGRGWLSGEVIHGILKSTIKVLLQQLMTVVLWE